jgi:RNA polymerase sigma-70 factor (ECF subfamily)
MDWTIQNRSPIDLEAWIVAARRGDVEAMGRAMLAFRDYLLLVANEELEPELRVKSGASDLVQETFLQAHRDIVGFQGQSPTEWREWMRGILQHLLANHRRRFRAAKRRVGREVAIDDVPREMSLFIADSPSRDLERQKREALLIAVLQRLPDRYSEVIVWHNKERLSFEEIGRRHNVSAEAARKRWSRALERLRVELDTVRERR